jgi:hypothetical protein
MEAMEWRGGRRGGDIFFAKTFANQEEKGTFAVNQ